MTDENTTAISHVYEITIRVRWNEMDANGHVNNMYYQSYFDEGRVDMFTKGGLDFDRIRREGVGPVLYRAEFDYIRELKHPEEAVIRSWMEAPHDNKAVIHQELYRKSDGKLVCRANLYGMFFNFKTRKSFPIPEDIIHAMGL